MTGHILNLARSLFFNTQNSPGTATARRPLLGSPTPSPSHPQSLTFLRRGDSPYLDHRSRPAIHVTSRAQPRFCACNPTSHTCPSGTRSVTNFRLSTRSSDQFPTAWLPILAPCVLAVPFEASAHSDVALVIRPPCCVGCIVFRHAIRCKTLCTHDQHQSQSGVYTR